MSDLLSRGAVELLRLMAKGTLGASELMSATLARIDAENSTLNAVCALGERDALFAAARAAERAFLEGTPRPLEGLPITIKDAFEVAGYPATAGAAMLKDYHPAEDARAVARLRAAGAIIIGKSTVPAFSGDFQSYNPLHGQVNNPHDPGRSPGGSSGGAAAALASGMTAFELGSDLGGSIRWPAHCCGLFALKPTYGLVSTYGHIPPLPERRLPREADLVVTGPLARRAEDLDLLIDILAQTPPAAPHRDSAAGLRIGLWLAPDFASISEDVEAIVRSAAHALADAGASVQEFQPAFRFEELFEAYSLLNHAIVAAGLPDKLRDRLAARALDFPEDSLAHEALQARGARLTPALFTRVQDQRKRLRTAFHAHFARFDVILCPVAPVPAIPHDQSPDFHARRLDLDGASLPYFDLLKWAAPATFCGLPAAVAPFGRSREGLPVGVQILADAGQDRQAIAVARMLEEMGPGFMPPPTHHRA